MTTGEQQQELVKVPRKITRELPVQLNESEMAHVAREIGRLNRERQVLEGQAKVSAQQWRDRIAGIEARIADLATKADEGKENRPIECEERYDYRRGEVAVVRLDLEGDAANLEVRPMTPAERQPNLPAPGMDTPKGEDVKPRTRKQKAADKEAAAANDTAGVDPDAPPADGAEIDAPQDVLDATNTKETK